MKTTKTIAFLIFILFIASCKKETNENIPPDPDIIDLSSYVAMGNSLTAGYADGALYTSGQEYSYANIIASQIAIVGGNGVFKTPIIPTEDGVYPSFGQSGLYLSTKLVLANKTNCLGESIVHPVRKIENPDQDKLNEELFTNISAQGPYNNLGVPGITVSNMITPGLGSFNPYYGRFATNASADKLIDEAIKVEPTFFSLWIGNNDVLSYATSGGTSSITTSEIFELSYNSVASLLSSITEGGIVANIPDIASAAYFVSIKYNTVNLDTEEEVTSLQEEYSDYNQHMESQGKDYRINWQIGNNPMVIRDKEMQVSEEFKIRQMTANELALISLPMDSILCATWGSLKPIGDQYILTESEITKTNDAVEGFNNFISITAEKYDLALIDMNALMKGISENGLTEDGINFSTEFIYGNLFSLDGIHITPQGNALVANRFIEAINSKYSTSIPLVKVSDYPAVSLP